MGVFVAMSIYLLMFDEERNHSSDETSVSSHHLKIHSNSRM